LLPSEKFRVVELVETGLFLQAVFVFEGLVIFYALKGFF